MTDDLQKLFGSVARVKLMRLFLFNPKLSFSADDVVSRARITHDEAKHELGLLLRAKLISEKNLKGKGVRFALNLKFEYVRALQNLLLNAPARGDDILERLRGVGPLKLIILSGIFMGEWEGHLDLLIVGDKVKEKLVRDRIRQLEAEIGKEMRYSLLSTENLYYRLNMSDKLIRDVLDYPHRVVLDRLNIGIK